MPVELGIDKDGCFARLGKQGAKYHYTCGNKQSKTLAEEKASRQGQAIEASKNKK